jgi:hypothetical protein
VFSSLLHRGGEPNEFGIFLEVTGIIGDFSIATNDFSSVVKARIAAIVIPSYRIDG